MTRRSLLQVGAAGLLASCAATRAAPERYFGSGGLPIGVQLYSVNAELAADLDGTLGALARIGYRRVELAGYYGRTPRELRAALDRAGLACISTHVGARPLLAPARTLVDDPAVLAEDAAILGFDTVILPLYHPPERLPMRPLAGEGTIAMVNRIAGQMTESDWRWSADYMNAKAAALKRVGLRFGFHNHNNEFAPVAGTTVLDILMRHTDPALVTFQLDAGWAASAGEDPAALIRRYPGRFTAMHVKDVAASTVPNHELRKDPIEVGSGIIDWKTVIATARAAGIERFFVEQEPPFAHPPLESLRINYDYLASLAA